LLLQLWWLHLPLSMDLSHLCEFKQYIQGLYTRWAYMAENLMMSFGFEP